MRKARAKIGSWPARMRSDGAAEYDSPEVQQLFLDNNIEHEWSNAGEQFQDCSSETLVNTLGRGVRVLLLFSGMAPEFWDLVLLHVANVCSAVVWQGRDLVDHGKLAPRGESGVFVGLVLMHGRKA
eukprot:530038-Rhodomonas_salina.1